MELNLNSEDFNILQIIHNLYHERIQYELETLNKDSERYKYLCNLISTTSNININDINNVFEKALKIQNKKPWRKLSEENKISKILEYCEEKKFNEETKNKLLNAVKNKKLKIANVDYDIENMKIININF